MIIKPYSSIATEAFVASDYPALAHYFPFTETSGSTITDVAGGLVVDDSSNTAVSQHASGYISLGANKSVILSGTVRSPAAKKVVILSAYQGPATIIKLGSVVAGTNTGMQMSSAVAANSIVKVSDGTTAYTSTDGLDGSASQAQARCAILDWGTDGTGGTYGLSLYDFDGTTWNARAAVTLATSSGITAIEQAITIQATSNPFNTQVWYFDTVPSDFKAATLWMFANAVNGTKTPYPAWKGRS